MVNMPATASPTETLNQRHQRQATGTAAAGPGGLPECADPMPLSHFPEIRHATGTIRSSCCGGSPSQRT